MQKHRPPKVFHRFFRWYCHPKLLSHIEGDLLELYQQHLKTIGPRKANWKFIKEVLLLCRPGIFRPWSKYQRVNHLDMIINYLTIGWRNLLRHKWYSAINLFGLTIGMTCTMLILLWVQDELNYNKSQEHYHRIHQIKAIRNFNNQIFMDNNMVLPLAQAIESEIPQVEQAVVTTHERSLHLRHNNNVFKIDGYISSPNFFQLFSNKFINGKPEDPLKDPHAIVLTASTAAKIFGDQDPIDQTLLTGEGEIVRVSAVVMDLPENTSIQYQYIRPFDYSSDYIKTNMEEWGSSSWVVFILTSPGANMSSLDQQITALKHRNSPGDQDVSTYFSFPMSKWRLYSDFQEGVNTGGLIRQVRLFSMIALIILVIACVNFMNLSTARSEKRAKEVGVRKTLGSLKHQLVYQFFIESILLSCLAFTISVMVVFLVMGSFNELVNKQLSLNLAEPTIWAGALTVVLFTGIVAGSYPALFLSSFNPVKVLKGTFVAGKKTILPRQALMVFQFVVSILLISATIIVYQQISMIKDRDIGYDPNNLIAIPSSDDIVSSYPVIKQELLETGLIHSVTQTMSPMTAIWWRTQAPDWEGKPADANMLFTGTRVGSDYVKTTGIQLLKGRDFAGLPADSNYVLLNERAVEEMNLESPVGQNINYDQDYTILGVTKNVIQDSPFEPVEPLIIFYDPESTYYVNLRLKDAISPKEALASIEVIFKKYNPNNVFEFEFVDQEFQRKFIDEELISKLSNIFAGLAVFICVIGLAGLAAFTIEKRFREISLRKILGATLYQLLMLISREFIKLVLLALVIAVPISWWLMNRWLENYRYQIEINGWLFVGVGFVILVLAVAVVCANTFKAAVRNPVKSLRAE